MPASHRLELVNLLMRAANELERQNPARSQEAPLFRHLAKLAAAAGPTGTDWDLVADAALHKRERTYTKIPQQRSRPDVPMLASVERGPRSPWSA